MKPNVEALYRTFWTATLALSIAVAISSFQDANQLIASADPKSFHRLFLYALVASVVLLTLAVERCIRFVYLESYIAAGFSRTYILVRLLIVAAVIALFFLIAWLLGFHDKSSSLVGLILSTVIAMLLLFYLDRRFANRPFKKNATQC